MRGLFGTDGIRGKANSFPLTPDFVQRLGSVVASMVGEGKRFIIGKDTRISSDMLEAALVAGITACGGICYCAGILSTPAISFLVKKMGMDFGIVISASHNPVWENGIKFFSSEGEKLPDHMEERIEEELLKERNISYPDYSKMGWVERVEEEACSLYIKSVIERFSTFDFGGRKIVVDCANGAASAFAERLFSQIGAECVMINASPNRLNINEECGSLHPQGCAKTVGEKGAWMGVCFDGDADRAIFVDEEGRIMDGDYIMAICAKYMKKEGMLKNDVVVSTIMSNMGLERFLSKMDVKLERTKVGDRFVWERMKQIGAALGGEQSGHIIFPHLSVTGDGVLTALMLFSILIKEGVRPLEYIEGFEKMPQILVNVKVSKREDPMSVDRVRERFFEVERLLGAEGRVNIRLSGTEDVVRIMVEAPDAGLAKRVSQILKEAVSESM